jgi:Sulfotransferase family
MHRAGTSMVANALRVAGLYLGSDDEFVPPAPDNPGGFFEHAGFVNLDEDLLEATGGAWDHVPPSPPRAADDPRVAGFRDRASELIGRLAVVPNWGWKDPRASLTARFWLDLLPGLRIVVCVRHPLEVALSLKQRNNTSYTHGLSLWEAYYGQVLDAVPAERLIVTHYDAYLRDPGAEVARIVELVGLPDAGVAEATAAPDSDLRHQRIEIGLAESGVSAETIRLYERLCEEAGEAIPAEGPQSEESGGPAAAPAHRSERPAKVDRNALDLMLANQQLERRGRQVASLERRRDELSDRVDELEAAGREDALAGLHSRIDRLEEALCDLRYRGEDLADQADVAGLRACRELVHAHVPQDAEVLVVTKSDPAWLDLYGRPTSNFPRDSVGRYPGFPPDHSVAAIAHLEARRVDGGSFLLIPSVASWWIEEFPEFAAHLTGRYTVAADEPGAGVLVDVRARRAPAEEAPRTLSEIVDRIGADGGEAAAVLDLTGQGLATYLPGRRVFSPSAEEGDVLAYLDDTIEVVVVPDSRAASANGTDLERRLEEARRVASRAVVSLAAGEGPLPAVAGVEWISPDVADATGAAIRFIVAADDPDPEWLSRVEEALAGEEAAEVVSEAAGLSEAAEGAKAIAIVDHGVLPLPGCCRAARSAFAHGKAAGAVAVKTLAADGSLEAAGTSVFADGSWAGIGAGSHKVVAPWHEYLREACGGTGLLFLAAEAVGELPPRAPEPAAGSPTSWAGSLWAAGLRVLYQPDAAAVRARGELDTTAAASARVAEAWSPALESRPPRPEVLDDAAWHPLLARDEVGAGWPVRQAR